jgi:peroxiredoxin
MPNRRIILAAIGALMLAASTLESANVPRTPPDFAVKLTDGQQVKLSQFKGKVVALAFILTSCPDCQKAVRCLIEDQRQFGPHGFQAIASATEDMARMNVPEFVRQFNPPFPVGYNELRPVLDFMQHPPMVGPRMPLIVFLDRQGVIRAQYEGHEPFLAQDQMQKNIRLKIVELMNLATPPVSRAKTAARTAQK